MSLLGNLFGGGTAAETDEQRERREQSRQRMAAGFLPLNAEERLKEQASRQGTPQHFFTSDLSVNELTLAHQAGYQPLGQVMGSSVYHVGWQWNNMGWNSGLYAGASWELEVLTQAFYNARHLAISRLVQEASLLGATGVIGMRLDRRQYEWGADLLEFAAVGTAIRENDLPPQHNQRLFISDLSGQEFWALRQGGYRPIHFVIGNCSYYQTPSWSTQNATSGGFFGGSWNNQELPDYTQALYTARELAMSRMLAEAEAAGAEGIVGANVHIEAKPYEVEVNNRTRTDMLYHFTSYGTAIASSPAGHIELKPLAVVSLG